MSLLIYYGEVMPKPEVINKEPIQTPGVVIINYFKDQYKEQGHGMFYSPTMVDRVNAKKMGQEYGIVLGTMMIDKFFTLKRLGVKSFSTAPMTLACLYFNRNELVRLLKESPTPKDDNEF